MFNARILNESNQYAMPEELEYISDAVVKLAPRKIVMIGAGPGVLALAAMEPFTYRHSKEMPELTVIDNMSTLYCQMHLTAIGVPGDKLKQVLMDSAEAGKKWTDGKVDLLIVDGDHSTGGVLRDIDAWYQHVADGGLIFFHDFMEREGGFNGSDTWKPGPVSVALELRKDIGWKFETLVGISAVYRK